MVEKHWDLIDAEFALAEGGDVPVRNGSLRYVGVATTEKVPNTITLVARGTSGHGSMPRLDNPIVHVAAAIEKIGAYQPPMRFIETTKTFFERTAQISTPDGVPPTHLTIRRLDRWRWRRCGARMSATTRCPDLDLPNIIKGGFRVNVIQATPKRLDARSLPGEDMDKLVADLKRSSTTRWWRSRTP
jgi:acetylornithine deacetylase/succinyl-diaminopimelate desuccinylase-like protein